MTQHIAVNSMHCLWVQMAKTVLTPLLPFMIPGCTCWHWAVWNGQQRGQLANSNPSTDTLSRFAWHPVLLGMLCSQKTKCVLQTVMLVRADMYRLLFTKCVIMWCSTHTETHINNTHTHARSHWHADNHNMVCIDQLTCTRPKTSFLRSGFVKQRFQEVTHHQTSVTSVTFVGRKALK